MAKHNRRQMENPPQPKDELQIKEKFELTPKQQEVIARGLDKNTKCLILDGVAGTGRTYISVLIALKLLNLKKSHGLTYIRTSIQSTDGEIGFLAGSISEKTEWMNAPLCSKLEELLIKPDIDRLLKENKIKTLPSSMLRGLTITDTTICDETQNAFLSTAETVMTRMSEHSVLILCGDSSGSQNDLGNKSGFKKICEMFNDMDSQQNGIFYYKFGVDDVVRSKLVKFVVGKFQGLNR